jgi:hypothetical protein
MLSQADHLILLPPAQSGQAEETHFLQTSATAAVMAARVLLLALAAPGLVAIPATAETQDIQVAAAKRGLLAPAAAAEAAVKAISTLLTLSATQALAAAAAALGCWVKARMETQGPAVIPAELAPVFYTPAAAAAAVPAATTEMQAARQEPAGLAGLPAAAAARAATATVHLYIKTAARAAQALSALSGPVRHVYFHRQTQETCKWNIPTSNSTFKSVMVSRMSIQSLRTTFAPHFLT